MKNVLLFLGTIIITVLGVFLWKQDLSISTYKTITNNVPPTQKENVQSPQKIPQVTTNVGNQNLAKKEIIKESNNANSKNEDLVGRRNTTKRGIFISR